MMNICVYGASSNAIDKRYIEAVEVLGEVIGSRGHGLVFGGGASGAMGAAARGVAQTEKPVIIGIAPSFFNVDGVLYEGCTELIRTETMRERKQLLEDLAAGYVIAPGGIGTYDEFFEMLTLKQLGRHNKPMVIYNVGNYYEPLLALMRHTVDGKFMNDSVMDLIYVTDDPVDAVRYIEEYDEPMHPVSFFKEIEEE